LTFTRRGHVGRIPPAKNFTQDALRLFCGLSKLPPRSREGVTGMKKPLVGAFGLVVLVGLATALNLYAQAPAPQAAPRTGTALVDMSAIMKNSARFNQAMERLKGEYESRARELQKEGERGNQLTEELRKMQPTDPKRKLMEQEILKLRADYELHGKRVTEEIRDGEAKIVFGLVGDLKQELDRYAKATGTQLILRNDPTPPELTDPRMILQEIHRPIVYQAGGDVTAKILESMNRGAPAATAPRTSSAPVGNPAAPVRR
jgi:Skp family chaperone for outer membrane proteins